MILLDSSPIQDMQDQIKQMHDILLVLGAYALFREYKWWSWREKYYKDHPEPEKKEEKN